MSFDIKNHKLPLLELTRAEFALIPKVKSSEEVERLAGAGFERVVMRGDCGNWFVCYPKPKIVYLVKFIVRKDSAAGAVKSTVLIEQVVSRKNALSERNKVKCHSNSNIKSPKP